MLADVTEKIVVVEKIAFAVPIYETMIYTDFDLYRRRRVLPKFFFTNSKKIFWSFFGQMDFCMGIHSIISIGMVRT